MERQIALQLYTLRDDCEHDFRAVLKLVGELGYPGVELFDLHGHSPEEVRGWLDDFGLVVPSRHVGLEAVESDPQGLANELAVLGCPRAAINWIDPPEREEDARAAVVRIARAAEGARDQGIPLGFHNHSPELRLFDGASTLDLLRELPPDDLWLELDLGWIWFAGADPVEELALTAGRCPIVHVKDLRAGPEHRPFGDGDVDYERIIPATEDAGVEWLVIEQDEIQGNHFAAVAQSLDALRQLTAVKL